MAQRINVVSAATVFPRNAKEIEHQLKYLTAIELRKADLAAQLYALADLPTSWPELIPQSVEK